MIVKRIRNTLLHFLGWLNQTMGRSFLQFHILLFSILIGSVIWDAIPQIVIGQITFPFLLQSISKLAILWVRIAGAFTVFWLLLRMTNLDLLVYYFILVPLLAQTPLGELYYRFLYGKKADRIIPRIKDIQASRNTHAEGYELIDGRFWVRYPSFINREHLERKSFWPHWVFAIVTIFNERSLSTIVEEKGGKKTWTLAVDLRQESFGIYSNRGKRFLSSQFNSAIEHYQELSQQTQSRFMPDAYPGIMPVIQGASIPMRWASGGFLPIIFYENKYWVSLFFRDIPPIGLNVANGATENKNEYKSLNRLIRREFSEEMILLPARPRVDTEMTQVMFESILPSTDGSTHQEYREADFVSAHARLRGLHDGFRIYIPPEEEEEFIGKRQLFPLDTPFRVTVRYHLPDLRRDKQDLVEFIVPSINPRENGIETMWLCTFEMKKGEYLIDGEYDLARNYLIRQPVILLDMDYLKRLYSRTSSLGELVVNQKDFDDVKRLPTIPESHFRLFDVDVELRQRRLEHLQRLLAKKDTSAVKAEYGLSTRKSQDAMTKEMTRIKTWLHDYEGAFQHARNGGTLDDPRLRCLCPVTWKTLELIFAHKINYRKFG